MRKAILLLLIFFTSFSVKTFSQDTNTYCNCFLPLDTLVFQVVPLTLGPDSATPPYYYNGNNSRQPVKLPFKFCFYGKNYDTIYIGTKGNVSFIKPIRGFKTGNLPAGADTAMIAPFWANIDTRPILIRPPGDICAVYLLKTATHIIIQWSSVGYSTPDDDLYDSFQLTLTNGSDSILPGGNNVSFCYQPNGLGWVSADSSGGSMGFGGIPCMIGINKGDKISYAQMGRFSLPGNGFYGPTSSLNGLNWLSGKSLTFNTCVTDKNIGPVTVNDEKCDTIEVCQFDTAAYAVHFLCAEQGQKAVITASSPTISGITVDTSSSSTSIYSATLKIPTNSSVRGNNVINIKATDNSVPPQATTYPIVVIVDVCTGINEVNQPNTAFSIYPNANNGIFTVKIANSYLPIDNTEFKIYDVLGKEIYSAPVNAIETQINLSNQAKGMYFIKLLKNNADLGSQKVLIQ